MKKTNRESQKGFTIIEVMIVLAIAGLIMLIVFMAVPALQRNSRNTQRKNDVSSLLSAVSEYQSNHNGALPTTTGQFSAAGAFEQSNPKLGYYITPANVLWNYSAAARGADPVAPTGLDSVTVFNYAKCADATTVTRTNATTRGIVALYNIEGSNGNVAQCQES